MDSTGRSPERAAPIGVFDSGVALVTAEVKVMVFAIGTVTEKNEPPLASASSAMP